MEHYATLIGIGIQTVLFILAGYGMVLRNDWSNKALKDQVEGIQQELKELSSVLTQLAVQGNRLDNLGQRMNMADKHIDELRRGEGFIKGARGIDREFP